MADIGARILSLDKFEDILFKEETIALDKAALEKVEASYQFLKNFSRGKLIYGINTGFARWPNTG